MKIGERQIGNDQPCYIIAEAGTGHLGSMAKAGGLVDVAKAAGADAVKFQMFERFEPLFCPLPGDEKRRERWDRSWLAYEKWVAIKWHCDEIGITFLASAFQETTVNWLSMMNVAAYKVASRAAATYPYDAVPGPFIVSEGVCQPVLLRRHGEAQKEAMRLQCVMRYPTPVAGARWTDMRGGLSDHSGTIWPGLDAMARGCPMLEVHFAIDKQDAGNDAPVCLTVDQLKLLCDARDNFALMRPRPR